MWSRLSALAIGTVTGIWWTLPRPIGQVLVLTRGGKHHIPFVPGMSWAEFNTKLDYRDEYLILDPTNEVEDEYFREHRYNKFAKQLTEGRPLVLQKLESHYD